MKELLRIETRDNKLHISGYVNAVERDSRPIKTRRGLCVEQIAAGAFAASISDGHEIRFRYNHKRDIGSTSDGTIELREDNIGLYAEAVTDDEELRTLAANGKLTGWSFGFNAIDDEIETRDGKEPRRRVNKLELVEVSVLSVAPAYDGTSVEVRGGEPDAEEPEYRSYGDYQETEETEETDEVRSEIDARIEKLRVKGFLIKAREEQRRLDALALREEIEELRRRGEEIEERYNQYHDPHNGRFASGSGAGGNTGEYLFVVPKGMKGQGILVHDIGLKNKKQANNYYLHVYTNSSINGLTPTGLAPNPKELQVINGGHQTNTTAKAESVTGEKFGVYGGRGTAYTIVTVDGENKIIRNDYIQAQKDGTLLISEKSLAIPRKSSIIDVSDEIKNSPHSYAPDSIAKVAKGEPMSFEQADNGAANPDYSKGTYGVTHNCQTCVVAHEARMRGYDVQAKSKSSANGYQKELSYHTPSAYIDPKTGEAPKMTSISSLATYDNLNSRIKSGERHEVEYYHLSGGHVITATKNTNGDVTLYDPQTNKKAVGRTEVTNYFDNRMAHHISSLRVDNLEFNENVVNNVLKKSKR